MTRDLQLRFSAPCDSLTLKSGNFRPFCTQAAIPPFALLIIRERSVKFSAAKIRPECFRYINLRIGDLPKQEVADAQLAAGADQQIRIRQPGGVKVFADNFFIDSKIRQRSEERRVGKE